MDPSPALDRLAAVARAALRAVLGADAAPEPVMPWRSHISTAYGRHTVDTEGLADALARVTGPDGRLLTAVTMPVGSVIVVDQDTFHPDGLSWDSTSVRTVPIGRARR